MDDRFDRFFAEIQDPRERALLEAYWEAVEPLSPEQIADRASEESARRIMNGILKRNVRPFLAMFDAALKAVRAP